MGSVNQNYSNLTGNGSDFGIGPLTLPTVPSNAILDSVVLSFNARRNGGDTGSSGKVTVTVNGTTITAKSGMKRNTDYNGISVTLTSYVENNNGAITDHNGSSSLSIGVYHDWYLFGQSDWTISNIAISVNYTLYYTLTTSVEPDSGGSVTAGGTYIEGSSQSITATPATGYQLKEWRFTIGSLTHTTDNTNPLTINMINNVSYTAVFEKLKYTVNFKNQDGTIVSTDTVEHGTVPTYNGSTPTKASTAQYTYAFSGWSPSLGAITGDTTYTAQFTSRRNGIYAGTSRAKAIYVGTTPVKAIYIGATKVYEQ